jgi:hypothetical protein
MTPKFLFYLHRRIFVEQYGRAEMLDILARKTLKSMARATGGRMSANKWMRTIEWLYRTTGSGSLVRYPELDQFVEAFKDALSKYVRTHKTSIGRVLMMLDYLDYKVGFPSDSTAPVYEFTRRLTQHLPEFEARNDLEFFREFTGCIDMVTASCGHIHIGSQIVHFVGNEESPNIRSSVCPACAQAAIDSGLRQYTRDNDLVLTQFIETIHTNAERTYRSDRRADGITFNERLQVYVDRYWTPYSNVIDAYHSSRTRGFAIVESAWFKRHRRAYGLELEVQNRNGENSQTAAGRIHEVLNPSLRRGEYCYFERDASIGEGFEIVTQPAGLDIHREKLALFLNNEDLKRGLRSHEGGNCGLHIHVGRQFLTQAQIYRVQSFLNDVRNEGLIRKISRRYSNSYARIKYEMAKLSAIGKNSGERYEALNVTNRDTVEFRIFRGSLRYESVVAALEFVDSLLTFCMPGQTSIMDFNAIGFRKFVTRPENHEDTTYLRSYLSLNANTDNEHRLAA